MKSRTRGLGNRFVGMRSSALKDNMGNSRMAIVVVGTKFAHITTVRHEAEYGKGTKGYATMRRWVTKRLK